MKNCNCNCDCYEIPADRKYILMKPLHLKHRTLPVGTIITGPINPIWFEDNIVKVYKGNVKPLSLEDIIQTSIDYDIRIENDKDIIFSDYMEDANNIEIETEKPYNKCHNNKKCDCCNKKCCCKAKNIDNSNAIIYDVGEASRVALEEKAFIEKLRLNTEHPGGSILKKKSLY